MSGVQETQNKPWLISGVLLLVYIGFYTTQASLPSLGEQCFQQLRQEGVGFE